MTQSSDTQPTQTDSSSPTPDSLDASTPAPVPLAGKSIKAITIFFIVMLGLLAIDLGVKYAAFEYVAGEPVLLNEELAAIPNYVEITYPHEGITVAPHLLKLRLTLNTGAVFGIGKGNRWVFVAVSLVAVVFIGYLFFFSHAKEIFLHVVLGMILSGALGNLYDRYHYAAVRDMFKLFPDVHLPFGLTWPGGMTELYPWIFNVADVALVLGVFLMIVMTAIKEFKMWQAARQAQANPDAQ